MSSTISANPEGHASGPSGNALSSADSESRFRQIFLSHLETEGYSAVEACRLIFKTPAPFHEPPCGASALESNVEVYLRRLEKVFEVIEDDHANRFPRAVLLKSISSFIRSLDL